jgi:hypothetical protein
MLKEDNVFRDNNISRDDNTLRGISRESMDCGRCLKCLLGGRCLNTLRDDNISRDELVQVPPPSLAPSFPKGIHNCSVCTFSSTTPFGLQVHKGNARSSLRESLSDEQICFIWHHLYLGWNGCFKVALKGIFWNYTQSQQFQVDFNYSLHRKGYMIREGRLYVQHSSYSACDLSNTQYSWINKEVNRGVGTKLSDEELWFIYYHRVDLKTTWARTYTAFMTEFPQHTGRILTSITSSFYSAFPLDGCAQRPSIFTVCENQYSWMSPNRQSPYCASVVEGR